MTRFSVVLRPLCAALLFALTACNGSQTPALPGNGSASPSPSPGPIPTNPPGLQSYLPLLNGNSWQFDSLLSFTDKGQTTLSCSCPLNNTLAEQIVAGTQAFYFTKVPILIQFKDGTKVYHIAITLAAYSNDGGVTLLTFAGSGIPLMDETAQSNETLFVSDANGIHIQTALITSTNAIVVNGQAFGSVFMVSLNGQWINGSVNFAQGLGFAALRSFFGDTGNIISATISPNSQSALRHLSTWQSDGSKFSIGASVP